ncbi:uncharacterized protein LOC124350644 [Daphnia pulicaria]|uniref:uncharacterized protein LOC124350644 n=1 Tax=Daphnia pulicaria TaxID=35523 RepID=UPI001EEAF419|nr:uncharacterized protein LOC124350644 [Daphnia pulicaria]
MVFQRAFILLFFVSFSYSAEILLECDKDIDCGDGYFCFQSYCERCIPCDVLFHRQPAQSSTGQPICAKYKDDCGICLPGYQANDLTDQRRSMECFPLNETVSTPDFSWTGIVWLGCVLFLTIACIAFFLHCRHIQPVSSNKEEEDLAEYGRRPSAPPAYTMEDPLGRYQVVPLIVHDETDHAILGSVRISDPMVIVEVAEHLSRAVPINYDDHFDGRRQSRHESDSEADEQQVVPFIDIQDVDSNGNGSTETIPSTWEPTPSASRMSMNVVLVRSQSEEMLRRTSSTSQLVRLASDPEILSSRRASVGGESYSHRHVRLSQYRSNSQIIDRPESVESSDELESNKLEGDLIRDSCLTEPCEDGREPDAPESFRMADEDSDLSPAIRIIQNGTVSTHYLVAFSSQPPDGQGSQDSGFQDQFRRRSRTNDDLLDMNQPAAISAKRRRRNCSENE